MDEDTRRALEGSIQKWQAIVAGTGADKGGTNCPLCQKFAMETHKDCEGCPVALRTGLPGCQNSPYDEWSDHQYDAHDDELETRVHCPECRRLAQAELDFLISLRP
jgi:hypothetical protein